MKIIKWNPDLAVGIEEIDDDHKKLLGCMNDLFIACYAGQGPAVIQKTLSSLKLFSREHFTREENTMHDLGFPELEAHRSLHDLLLAELDRLNQELEDGSNHEISNKTLKFLEDCLLQHIILEDMKIGHFIPAST